MPSVWSRISENPQEVVAQVSQSGGAMWKPKWPDSPMLRNCKLGQTHTKSGSL